MPKNFNPKPASLRVLTWNLAFAQGKGSEGVNYHPRTKKQMQDVLQQMGQWIEKSQADVVLLQEVDFHSKRSHYLDQVELLKKSSGLSHAASLVTWDKWYVPYPYWPPQNHFGRIVSGAAILSRYPITESSGILLPKPPENSWIYNFFYLHRFFQMACIQKEETSFWVMNVHLEAFQKNTRMRQALLLKRQIENGSKKAPLLVIGGDLNTVPTAASRKKGFPGEKEDYESDETLPILDSISNYQECVSKEEYVQDEKKFFTFPSEAPNRRLDYLYFQKSLKLINAQVLSTGDLSDHLPFLAEWE